MHLRGDLATLTFAGLVVALSGLASLGVVPALLGLGFASLLCLVSLVGFERGGYFLTVVAMVLAPLDTVRPGAGLLTLSDVAFGAGFIFLLPAMVRAKRQVPALFGVGAILLIISSVVSSTLAAIPAESFGYSLRLVAATILLPLAIALWSPERRQVMALASGYIVGQTISTLYALFEGTVVQGRYDGLTTHFNIFGLSGMIAFGLSVYLFQQVRRENQWVALLAASVSLLSCLLSGSRAATFGVIVVVLLYSLVERSAKSAVWVIGLAVASLASLGILVDRLGPGSSVARLLPGEASAVQSDITRENAFDLYFDRFLASPVLGEGFSRLQYEAHNVFLQVAVALGVVGLVAFLILGWSLAQPLLSGRRDHALSYLAVSYAVVCPITPNVWDRSVWAGLCLAILAGRLPVAAQDSPPTPAAELQRPVRI